MTVTEKTWPVADLLALAAALLEKSGLDHAKAETVAELLVEADLMGHDTHGLALLPRYLEEIAAGAMTIEGAAMSVSMKGCGCRPCRTQPRSPGRRPQVAEEGIRVKSG